MNDFSKELIINNYLKKLVHELVSENISSDWTKQEILWYVREKILKFAWFPVIERRTEEYKNFKLKY